MRRLVLIDAGLALAVLAVGVAVTAPRGLSAAELVVSVAMVAPLALRRVAPVRAFVVVVVVAAVSLVVSDRVIAGDPAPLIALFSLVAYAADDRARLAGVGVLALGAVPTGARWADGSEAWVVAGAIGIAVVHILLAAALGELRRQALRREAERLRAAAADERTRIARELHDVVAHALAVVVVQADAGRFAAASDPAAAAGTLQTIGDTARAALTDMRAALGALRAPEPQPGRRRHTNTQAWVSRQRAAVDRAPQPSERDLDALVGRLADAGLAVDLAVEGDARPLGDAAGLAVYRLVQEALTNVVKHAGDGAAARVRIAYDPDAVAVTVTDDGGTVTVGRSRGLGGGHRVGGGVPGGDGVGQARGIGASDGVGSGSGLIGMRERVGVAGGTVETGPQEDGGWRVHARLPA